MNAFQAVVLGVVQGLTEFVPVSSTAHLRIVPALAGWEDPGAAFTAVVQLGTMVAVLAFFRADLLRIARAWVAALTRPAMRRDIDVLLGWYILVGTIPIGLLGLAFKHQIEGGARSLALIAASLIAVGIVMLVAERSARLERTITSLTRRDAGVIGLAQAAALVPGVSRSGATISAGLFLGLDRAAAARYSFLLSIPAVVLSGLFELKGAIGSGSGTTGVRRRVRLGRAAAALHRLSHLQRLHRLPRPRRPDRPGGRGGRLARLALTRPRLNCDGRGASNALMDTREKRVVTVASASVSDMPARARPRANRRAAQDDTVTRAIAGDQQAFAVLVDRHGQAVMSLCYASTLNPNDAEELAQEVFLAAWRGLSRFRGEASFSTWLFSLTRNACVDRARRAAARPRLASAHEQENLPGPSHDEEDRRTARAILEIAARLPTPQRQALLLRDVQGLAYEEIATLQDVPVGTVRSRISSARATVAEELTP